MPGASTGANDVPVIIQDRNFDSNNQFLYNPNMMWGYLGNRILVNGKPDAALSLEPRGYRLRFLNGSNARTYKLAWSNNMPLKVIGTDGGLLPAAVSKSYVMLMPGERVDVWADFASLAGKQVILRSLAFEAGGMGMMGGMGGGMMGGGMMGGGMMGGGMMGGGMGIGRCQRRRVQHPDRERGKDCHHKSGLGTASRPLGTLRRQQRPQLRHAPSIHAGHGAHDDLDDQRARL